MTKEEEKKFKQQVLNETVSRKDELMDAAKRNAAIVSEFIKGAEWADQNPRKGLWDSEKVINYIYHHAHVRTFGDIVIDDMSVTKFIETMKKAKED